jgi:hypothetical protein
MPLREAFVRRKASATALMSEKGGFLAFNAALVSYKEAKTLIEYWILLTS